MKLALALILILALSVDFGEARRKRKQRRSGSKRDVVIITEDDRHDSSDGDAQQDSSYEDASRLKWIKAHAKTANLAADTARTKAAALPHLLRGMRNNLISAIKLGILAQVNGLHALRASGKAHRRGHQHLARLTRRQGYKAIAAGKALMLRIRDALLKCLKATAALLQNFFGVDVASLFGPPRDPTLALRAARLANRAAIAANHAQHKAKQANKHAKSAAKVALEIAEKESN